MVSVEMILIEKDNTWTTQIFTVSRKTYEWGPDAINTDVLGQCIDQYLYDNIIAVQIYHIFDQEFHDEINKT